jgi:pimeloyl-ACP methyl ester carboxylesterase
MVRRLVPTLTGLGERAHLASPEIGLSTHVQDVLGVLHYEDLREVVLVGHSYGGAVVTGVADHARNRIQRLIYMDGFVLKDGQSLRDVCPPGMTELLVELARQSGEGWRVPSPFTMEQFGADLPEDIAWNGRGIVMHPLKAFVEPLTLHPEPLSFPVTYIRFTDRSMGLFEQFSKDAQAEGWDYHEVQWTHAAPAVVPEQCAELLIDVAKGRCLAS